MVVIPKIINIPPHNERWYKNCEKLKKLIMAEIIIN
jgi:hypothetical protein